jgi:hypothetical protein
MHSKTATSQLFSCPQAFPKQKHIFPINFTPEKQQEHLECGFHVHHSMAVEDLPQGLILQQYKTNLCAA